MPKMKIILEMILTTILMLVCRTTMMMIMMLTICFHSECFKMMLKLRMIRNDNTDNSLANDHDDDLHLFLQVILKLMMSLMKITL